jgi:hypothetical protein
MEARTALETSSYERRSLILSALATTQKADGRFDLAHETTRLAFAGAVAAPRTGGSCGR